MTHKIKRYSDLGVATCAITGDLDFATVPELQKSLGSLVEAGYISIVLDLSEVDYIDSMAFSLLVWLDRRLADVQGSVILAGANKNVQRILDMTQVMAYMPTVNTSESLIAALQIPDGEKSMSKQLWEHRLEMQSSIENLTKMRYQVDEMLSSLNFPESEMFDIKIALGEALANAIRHGSGNGGGMVTVAIRAFEDRVVIDVADSGTGFSGAHCASEDLYAPSGRGIMFMHTLMDSVKFAPGPIDGTVVTMEKRRGGSSGNSRQHGKSIIG